MKIICYGDSNTVGYDPRTYFCGCYDSPWPQLLAELSGWAVQNCGENGREIPGFHVKFPSTIDLLIVMLGTNDLLQGNTPETVERRMELFLESVALEKSKILLIAPPAMKLGAWVSEQSLIDASKELVYAYQNLSQKLGIRFANADQWNVPLAFDGVHFTQEGHRTFADGLLDFIMKGVL